MAKYATKRTELCFEDNGRPVTEASSILSFRADVEDNPFDYWCGFYNFNTNSFNVLFSGAEEIYSLELDVHENDTLSDLETRLRNLIYDFSDEWVRIVAVADDYSCMKDMTWVDN